MHGDKKLICDHFSNLSLSSNWLICFIKKELQAFKIENEIVISLC